MVVFKHCEIRFGGSRQENLKQKEERWLTAVTTKRPHESPGT
jgi:hypothetical protein